MNRPLVTGLVIAVFQGAIVASLGVQAALQRERLPRVWVQAVPGAVGQPVRGRYLRVPVLPLADTGVEPRTDRVGERTIFRPAPVTLEARDGQLLAHKAAASHVNLVVPQNKKGQAPGPVLWPPVEYFVPPAAGDPAGLIKSELWLEVSVPRQGVPRALRLGTKKDGKITPLEF